jgi:F0F1-type ATP synthase membrane subunit b/b'
LRAAAVAEARLKARAQIEQAQAAIEQDKVSAKQNLEGEAGHLATEIIRTVLAPAVGGR